MDPASIAIMLALRGLDYVLGQIALTPSQQIRRDLMVERLLAHEKAGTVPTEEEWDREIADIDDLLARSQAAANRVVQDSGAR